MTQTFKEYLRPKNGYTEGPMSLVTHNGILYKLDYMFELSADLPVTMISLDDLRWQVENLQADEARTKKADIKVPIIVTPQNGQYIILDGTHRVLKALKAGEKSVPARVIFSDILGMTRLGSGSDVAWASNVDDINPYLGEAKGATPWAQLNAAAESQFGEFGFATLDSDQAASLVKMKAADKIAKEQSETGFMTLSEPIMKKIINAHPELLKK
jgi:hypothetical protein